MMSFCKTTLHALLGTRAPPPPPKSGLVSVTGDGSKPANVLESSSLKPSPKKDSVRGSSVDGSAEITNCSGGSAVDGLSSCTESLGFESSEQMEDTIHESSRTAVRDNRHRSSREIKMRQHAGGAGAEKEKGKGKEKEKEFPPVMSSLRGNGGHYYTTSFLKPVRENGRLTLTPVTIDRKDIFLASRQDGRLRLQLTKSEVKQDKESDSEPKKINPVVAPIGGEGSGSESGWGSGLSRRCYEPKSHRYRDRRNRHQLWNQQCVTSR